MDGENTHQEISKGKRLIEESKSNFRRGKPPDKRRHQMEMNHWTDLIQKKEALLKSSNVPKLRKSTSSVHGNRDELLVKLRSLRSEKEEKMKQKQVIDVEIKSLNQQVVKKNETCMKLQANVKYKDEQRTNNAIKHLERHLTTHQLKLSEEKKLVCEIDALKRSKKTLSEYLSAKQEVDQLRLRQSGLRNERDILMRETHDIKARENDVKVSLDSLKEEIKETDNEEKKPAIDRDALKKEVDSLYEKRRELHESYQQELASYHEEQKQNEKDKQQLKAEQRRDETRLTKITADRARHEKRHESKPFEEEKNICLCLIQYLEPLIAQCSVENDEVDGGNKISFKFLDVPKCEASGTEEGSFVMKRDQDDNLGGLFVQSNRRMTRKGSRKGRKSKDSAQKLVLHPHVFEQFFKLSLEPPSTYADVGGILEKLREKFRKYWCEAGSTKPSEPMPVIPENLASKDIGKKDIGLRYELPSRSPNAENQTSNEMLTEHGTEEEKHEMAKFVPEMDKVEYEIVKDEHKTDDAQPETMRIEHEMEQLEHEPNQREHEVQQLEHEPEQTEHEVRQLEHEPEQDEHEPIRVAHESEREEREMIENLHGKDQHECVDDEEDIFRNERSSCTDEQIATENLLNKEGSELSCKEHNEVLNSSCMNCSTVITDALEKGMDSINIKETSQEIQVRVT